MGWMKQAQTEAQDITDNILLGKAQFRISNPDPLYVRIVLSTVVHYLDQLGTNAVRLHNQAPLQEPYREPF